MIPVTRSIYQIRTPMGPHFVNSHLVVGDQSAALIDTGLPITYELVLEAMEVLALPPDRLKLVLITHGHPDHIGSNSRLREKFTLQIIAPAAAVRWIEDHEAQYQEFPSAFQEAFDPDERFKKAWFELMSAETSVDVAFEGKIQVNLGGGVVLQSSEFPGHSAHETAYFEISTKCLILGDAIALDHPDGFPAYEHPVVYRRSLQHILSSLKNGEVDHLVAGHFEVMDRREAENLLKGSLKRIDEIEAAILDALGRECAGLTLRDLCQAVANRIGRTFNFQTPWTVNGHLNHLSEDGRLVETNGLWTLR